MQDRTDGLTVIEGGKAAPVVEIGEKAHLVAGSKAWSSKVRRRAKELTQMLDLGYMELARILYQVYDTPVEGDPHRGAIFTSWGYASFGEYAEKELGLHNKKAERLRLIWYSLEIQLKDLDPALKERAVNLGYSKIRELVRVLTLRNAQDWIEQAEKWSYRQLYAAVIDEKKRQGVEESLLGPGGSASETDDIIEHGDGSALPEVESALAGETFKQERFDLAPEQLKNVRLALKKASELANSEKKGHLLDLICTDFIATNDSMGADMESKIRYIAKIERSLGLKLIVVDPSAKDVVYGMEALELVAGA